MTKLDNISPEVKTMLCDLIFQIEYELGEENKQLKERIDKAIEYLNKAIINCPYDNLPLKDSRWGENLIEILKGE